MAKRWIESTGEDNFAEQFWSSHRDELRRDAFWADEIKSLRGDPEKRFNMAIDNLPLPAAFQQAAVALRTIVRDRRKNRQEHESVLRLLYGLAALESFGIPYSTFLRQPGFNVLESIPGARIAALPFEYKTLGYSQLELLNKTDIKWITEHWGEPVSHSTLNKMYETVWREAEIRLKEKQESNSRNFFSMFRS